jgi:hypothetical protein
VTQRGSLPEQVRATIERLVSALSEQLGERVVGVYVTHRVGRNARVRAPLERHRRLRRAGPARLAANVPELSASSAATCTSRSKSNVASPGGRTFADAITNESVEPSEPTV